MIKQRGFILVATLWVLAILTVAASFFALWTQRSLVIAQNLTADVHGEIALQSTLATLLYLLSTQRFTIAGMTIPASEETETIINQMILGEGSILPVGNEIALDDTVYQAQGKVHFAIQDISGLLGINIISETVLSRFLGLLGVPEDKQAALADKLYDYVDLDDLHRLNGAEKHHYEQRKRPPPPNQFLMYPGESYRILDWQQHQGLWRHHALAQLSTTEFAALPNFNTAPKLVLQAAYNMDAQTAQRLISLRHNQPFYTVNGVSQALGIYLDIDPLEASFFPSNFLRLSLWYEGASRMQQIHLRLTHNVPEAKPWQIDHLLNLKLLNTYAEATPRATQIDLFKSPLSAKTP